MYMDGARIPQGKVNVGGSYLGMRRLALSPYSQRCSLGGSSDARLSTSVLQRFADRHYFPARLLTCPFFTSDNLSAFSIISD